jgi:hypothetical protein
MAKTSTTATITTYFRVTEEQINFCTRIEQDGKVFYYVASQTTIGQDYKVQYNTQHHVLQCNCAAGSQGNGCWHKRAALAAEKIHQAERQAAIEATEEHQHEQAEQACYVASINLATIEASSRERQAVARDGYKAYERPPFDIMREQAQERNATTQCADGSWW